MGSHVCLKGLPINGRHKGGVAWRGVAWHDGDGEGEGECEGECEWG